MKVAYLSNAVFEKQALDLLALDHGESRQKHEQLHEAQRLLCMLQLHVTCQRHFHVFMRDA